MASGCRDVDARMARRGALRGEYVRRAGYVGGAGAVARVPSRATGEVRAWFPADGGCRYAAHRREDGRIRATAMPSGATARRVLPHALPRVEWGARFRYGSAHSLRHALVRHASGRVGWDTIVREPSSRIVTGWNAPCRRFFDTLEGREDGGWKIEDGKREVRRTADGVLPDREHTAAADRAVHQEMRRTPEAGLVRFR